MKTDDEIRLEIVSLFYKPGRPLWTEVEAEAQSIFDWVKQGTQGNGPASAKAAPTPSDIGGSGPGDSPGQAAPQRNQTSRNNPTGRA